jgi:hypothetical protein
LVEVKSFFGLTFELGHAHQTGCEAVAAKLRIDDHELDESILEKTGVGDQIAADHAVHPRDGDHAAREGLGDLPAAASAAE